MNYRNPTKTHPPPLDGVEPGSTVRFSPRAWENNPALIPPIFRIVQEVLTCLGYPVGVCGWLFFFASGINERFWPVQPT